MKPVIECTSFPMRIECNSFPQAVGLTIEVSPPELLAALRKILAPKPEARRI